LQEALAWPTQIPLPLHKKPIMSLQEIEIVSPVGSYESLMAAIQGGAGSVYFGAGKLNMRARLADELVKSVFLSKSIVQIKAYGETIYHLYFRVQTNIVQALGTQGKPEMLQESIVKRIVDIGFVIL